jgi:hypothetical protein
MKHVGHSYLHLLLTEQPEQQQELAAAGNLQLHCNWQRAGSEEPYAAAAMQAARCASWMCNARHAVVTARMCSVAITCY